jgi:murein DD-endopeptidase MepM/ murein hydrolase activator NlpD
MTTAIKGPRGASPLRERKPFPRQHFLLAFLLLAAVAISSGFLFAGAGDPITGKGGNTETAALTPELQSATPAEPAIPEPQQTPPTTPEAALLSEPASNADSPWREFTIRSGDNLSLVFQRAGLNDGDVHDIVNKTPGGKSLTKIYPGQTLGFQYDDQQQLMALRYVQSPLASIVYTRGEDGYEVETLVREPVKQRTFISATIRSSLYLAGQDAGLSQNTIMELANIFGGVINFVLDPRAGDTFHVLYEELYLDGEKFRDGEILAAEFVNRGKSETAFRYTDESGKAGYYSEDGVSMRKAFLLAPVDFTRISSNFNLRRLHPIYKTTRPHRGTDYAAPTGTPVYAAGDGRVVKAGYSKANGNYVFIKHGEQYTTKYLHLHKRKVRKGARVQQQQIIGTVGSTGAATGPHLHYEFLMNGVHRNPRTIHKKLPRPRSLPSTEIARFRAQIQPFTTQLASIRQNHLAENSSEPRDTAAL